VGKVSLKTPSENSNKELGSEGRADNSGISVGLGGLQVFQDERLTEIWAKLEAGKRLDRADGRVILETPDLLGLGYMADRLRMMKAGEIVTFVGNFHVCYTNICIYHCRYCIFRRKASSPDAFTLTLEQIEALARECQQDKYPEILLMGGINPELSFDFFLEALRRIKRIVPGIHILAFSPVEIDHFARVCGEGIEAVLMALKECGLTAITGGGAEIFSPRVRRLLGAEEKISGERWLEIMEAAHGLGIRSNACIMYGAGETLDERLEHLERIRKVQDRTSGFTHILPFAFADPHHRPTTGYDDLRMIALCRLYLDNFAHVRAYWSYLGLRGAQVALAFGADDLNGLRQKGRIIHSSGGQAGSQTTPEEMISLIKDTGRIPAQRDILFNIVEKYA